MPHETGVRVDFPEPSPACHLIPKAAGVHHAGTPPHGCRPCPPPSYRPAACPPARRPARQRPPALLRRRGRLPAVPAGTGRGRPEARLRGTRLRADDQPHAPARDAGRARRRVADDAGRRPPLRRLLQRSLPSDRHAVGRPLQVGSSGYVLACYRYIELNPVRARMVAAPPDYPWSSYDANALGHSDAAGTFAQRVGRGGALCRLLRCDRSVPELRAVGCPGAAGRLDNRVQSVDGVRPVGCAGACGRLFCFDGSVPQLRAVG